MKKFVVLFLFLVVSTFSYGQDTPEAIVDKFFKEYSSSPVKALENIYATNSWVSRNKDITEQVKSEIIKLTPDYVGKYYGYEPIIKRQLSSSFVLRSYLVKYDRQPIRFTFEFYKASDKWSLFSFNFDTNLDDELEESAKLNYMVFDPK